VADNISWLKIASGTAKPRFSAAEVQRMFAAADCAGRLSVPDTETCEKVATRLEELLSLPAAPPSPVSVETRKYARLLLRHLARDYAAIEALGASSQSLAGWDSLVTSVREAVDPLAGSGGAGTSACNCAAVARLAQAAWRQSGREPRSISPDSPLAAFVAAVLARDSQWISYRLRRK
jgi:hypothetical protein